jgi:hypothetical protein
MKKTSLFVLQWSLGLTVLIEALLLAFSAGAIHAFAKTGMHDHIRLGLAWGEIAGAILFLISPTVVAGGWILCVVFVSPLSCTSCTAGGMWGC